jgi:DNA-binding HxlR family transcriptional regulator
MSVKSRLPSGSKRRSDCPISCALDLWGDKWSLLVIRDLFLGKKRYNALLASEEGITTNILADRLRRLERNGLIRKKPYQKRPLRHEYQLTAAARDLWPVITEIVRWSEKHLRGTRRSRAFV